MIEAMSVLTTTCFLLLYSHTPETSNFKIYSIKPKIIRLYLLLLHQMFPSPEGVNSLVIFIFPWFKSN